METSYTKAAAPAKEEKTVTNEGRISKSALVAFVTGAIIVFSIAIYYCYSTGYKEVAAILAVAGALIGVFAYSLYRSFK